MDLISRDEAIKALGEMPEIWEDDDRESRGEQNQWHRDKTAIEAIPTALRWIPVTERLPEEEENVLVTVHFKGLNQKFPSGWNDHIKECWYVDIANQFDGVWSSYSDEYKVARSRHEVIAWMPLPEPYKEEI